MSFLINDPLDDYSVVNLEPSFLYITEICPVHLRFYQVRSSLVPKDIRGIVVIQIQAFHDFIISQLRRTPRSFQSSKVFINMNTALNFNRSSSSNLNQKYFQHLPNIPLQIHSCHNFILPSDDQLRVNSIAPPFKASIFLSEVKPAILGRVRELLSSSIKFFSFQKHPCHFYPYPSTLSQIFCISRITLRKFAFFCRSHEIFFL